MSEYKLALIVLNSCCVFFLKRRVFYWILMRILICGHYVNYYVCSWHILTQYSSLTHVLKLWTGRNARRFPSTWLFKTNVSTIHCSIQIFFYWKIISTNAQKMVKFKMCHSKWCHKVCNQTFCYMFIVVTILDKKIIHGLVLITFLCTL